MGGQARIAGCELLVMMAMTSGLCMLVL